MAKQPVKTEPKPEIKPASRTIRAKNKAVIALQEACSPENQGIDKYLNINTIPSLVDALRNDKEGLLDIEAKVFYFNKKESTATRRVLTRKSFIEAFDSNSRKRVFREGIDSFATGDRYGGSKIGSEEVPLLGGPFNKQMYMNDMLKSTSQAFYMFNHHPAANRVCKIISDFVLGRGFRVDIKNNGALALWRAFEKVNELPRRIRHYCLEMSIYGEQFVRWLPNGEKFISYDVYKGQEPPIGIIPRIRSIDPSIIWDFCTYPEDIERVLFYQLIYPTQWQMFTGTDAGKPVTGMKFIYEQVPADQIMHRKINDVSNEKRGRSDLFPAMDHLKYLQDSVLYSIIGMQKAGAWSIDTKVEGNQTDIDNYISDQAELGTIPPPGSEFVHSSKIERTYLGNGTSSAGGGNEAFAWCLSMVSMATGIPIDWLGAHLQNGGSTRANAIVKTEPVAKFIETRRQDIQWFLEDCAERLFKQFGLENVEIEVTFPEIQAQDRSAKLKDLALAQTQGWFSKETCSTMAAKEFDYTSFDFEEEQKMIEKETPEMPMDAPLTTPGKTQPGQEQQEQTSTSVADQSMGLSGKFKKGVKDNRGY